MAETFRVAFPEAMAAYITPDPTTAPTIANSALAEVKVSTQAPALPMNSAETVMPPKKVVGGQVTATTTIDFTAAPDPRNPAVSVDCTGKYLLSLSLYATPENTALINVAPGGSPYPIFGASNDIDIYPGELIEKTMRREAAGTAPSPRMPAVAAGVKHMTITITSGTLTWVAVFSDA